MFLNAAVLQQDSVFADDGYGNVLKDTSKKLLEHGQTLRFAFNLTASEYDQIIIALGYDANSQLTLANVSAIYRRGWLARRLQNSVRELLLLMQFTRLDPFAAPDPVNPAILLLVRLVQAFKARSFKEAAVLYLIWNQDLSGKSAPASENVSAFARALRSAFAAVEAELAVADDPDGSIAQSRMALVFGTDAASFFFGLLNNTIGVDVAFGDPDGTLATPALRQAIENAAGKTDAGTPRIAYDDFRKRLSYSGVLTAVTCDAVKAAAGATAAAFKTAMDDLYNKNAALVGPFFVRYPELQSPYAAYVADAVHSVAEKRTAFLKAILPQLVGRRKRQQALQSLSAVANTDPAVARTLLDASSAPFPLHAVGVASQPAVSDLVALETGGLSVKFFANDTATGPVIPSPDLAPQLDYAPLVGGVGNPLPANPTPGAAISGAWSGYVEAPESGFFALHIEADAGATVKLLFDGKSVNLMANAAIWSNTDPIELRLGRLYAIELTVEKVRNVVHVQWDWQPQGQGRAAIPARYLYPAASYARFAQTYVRFLKVASLASGLGMSAGTITFFATRPEYRLDADGWLNALAVSGDPAPGAAAALLKPLQALLDFARIKADISPGDDSLLSVLQDPVSAAKTNLLFAITRWDQSSLNDVLAYFGGDMAGLQQIELFRRVYDALALAGTMGIAIKAVLQATTNEPVPDTAHNLQGALRALYDPASWRDLVRPIADEMRALQRDALVASVLHQMRSDPERSHIDTPDKLLEYFLMDVQMDPCMQTSRVRHAISSVQLFIERCQMNLEPQVSPRLINAPQWAWMKRYRVWEANRKVFLFPENWLEPELRDDKTPFFKELESELLQSDITEDAAAAAFLNYLSKLEEVAKLEPCGMHYVEATDQRGEVIHLVARTGGAQRKYYYRRYEFGSWTPWGHIKLEIEDNPVIPVVWKDRLLLFWLRLLKKGPDGASMPPGRRLGDLTTSNLQGSLDVTIQAVLCWSEFYNGKWQPAKTSDLNLPTTLDSSLPETFKRAAIHLGVVAEGESLRVYVKDTPVGFWTRGPDGQLHWTEFWPGSYLIYNTHSVPVRGEDAPISAPPPAARKRDFSGDRNYDLAFKYTDGSGAEFTRDIIKTQIRFDLMVPRHEVKDIWNAPVFFTDSRHVFRITTKEEPARLSNYDDFGILVSPVSLQAAQIPPLVVQVAPPPRPRFWGDGAPIGADTGIDSASMQRFVTEDAYISRGVATVGTVKFGDHRIGPSGTVPQQ
jgi:hypothetical protein